jgi:hypothetical protein
MSIPEPNASGSQPPIQDKNAEYAMAVRRVNFIKAAEVAAAKNPKISPEIFLGIIATYDEHDARFREEISDARRTSLSDLTFKTEANTIRTRHYQEIKTAIAAKHGQPGMDAWEAIATQSQPDSFFTPLVKKVYDSDKGGMQWGGLIGLLAGGAAAYYFTAESGMLFNVIATVGAALVGAFALGSMFNGPDKKLDTPDFLNAAEKAREKSRGQERAPALMGPQQANLEQAPNNAQRYPTAEVPSGTDIALPIIPASIAGPSLGASAGAKKGP